MDSFYEASLGFCDRLRGCPSVLLFHPPKVGHKGFVPAGGLGGVSGAHAMRPYKRFAVMVQRNAAGSLRVSLSSIIFMPPRVGDRGLTKANVMMMQQDAAGVWGVPRLSILPPRMGDQGG
jgi:hypothetical protein